MKKAALAFTLALCLGFTGQALAQNTATSEHADDAYLRETRAAAEQGDADAQDKLGEMYLSGRGVLQDFTQAVTWYRKVVDRQIDEKSRLSTGI